MASLLQCYNKGCQQKFDPSNNPEGKAVETLKDAARQLKELDEELTRIEAQQKLHEDGTASVTLPNELFVRKRQLDTAFSQLESDEVMQALKRRAIRVKRKRAYRQRRAAARQQSRLAAQERIRKMEEEFAGKQRALMQTLATELRDAEVKREADSVLAEVRRKISGTTDMLERVSVLEKLRTARKMTAEGKSMYVAPSSDTNFQRECSRLKKVLENSLNEYYQEEKALRVMLDQDEPVREKKKSEAFEKRTLSALFGVDSWVEFAGSRMRAEEFVANRWEWDKYLSPLGTSIPIRWVVPPEPSSAEWAMMLSSNQRRD